MHYVPYGPDSWANLPRNGGIAYAAQESWVQNETIRQNILFDKPYDEARYKKGAVSISSLRSNLEVLTRSPMRVKLSTNARSLQTWNYLKRGIRPRLAKKESL
jgi:hypothetical protein